MIDLPVRDEIFEAGKLADSFVYLIKISMGN